MKKIKRWHWIVGTIILLIVIIWWWQSSKGSTPTYSTVNAESGPLVQTVSETGTLKPVKEVALNFLCSGRIKSIDVKVGDKIEAGAVLASLDNSSLQSRKAELEAGLQIAQASLAKTMAGASAQSISVSRSNLNQAQSALDSAKIDLTKTTQTATENIRQAEKTLADLQADTASSLTPQEQAVNSAQTSLDNAIKTGSKNITNARSSALLTLSDKILTVQIALDNINTILSDEKADPVLSVKNSSLLSLTTEARLAALALVSGAQTAVNNVGNRTDQAIIETAGQSVQNLLNKTDTALDYTYAMLEASITSSDFSQANLDAYKTLISSQSTQINTASTAVENSLQALRSAFINNDTAIATAQDSVRQAQVNLSNAILAATNNVESLKLSGAQQTAAAQSRVDSAEQAVAVAKAQLNNTLAPARTQDVALAQAQVSQAQASLAGIEQQINDTVLSSPLEGIVTAVNYEIGEQFGAGGKAMVTILVNNSFNVEVDISESNISKIKVGDAVDITFDAFPEDFILQGFVSFIEPAQTLIQDVVYYKVKIDFSDLNSTMSKIEARGLNLKAGMTANIVITTDKRDNVLQVPARALIENNGQKMIRLLVNGEAQEVIVETGLRGDEGMIEVVSGLQSGDTVITFVKN
ncbi:efflux RND transporter periplasmic adaptor subunit [Patescibacteria group bacterium]|nr:efflux RND transporter periplasmic adaptor subunit [Patescibacteria group bacterium]